MRMKRKKLTDVYSNAIKRVPQRTCIACRQVKAKRELVRIVKTSDGLIVDADGKKPGRGAYLCKVKECWENGLKGNRMEFVMRTVLPRQDRQQLEQYMKKL